MEAYNVDPLWTKRPNFLTMDEHKHVQSTHNELDFFIHLKILESCVSSHNFHFVDF